MALDAQTAQRLWSERYENYFRALANKNKYLHDTQDPDDLFQDFAENVWLKAVNKFEAERTTYAGEDVDRAFNAWVSNITKQYLANLAAHRETGKQEWERTVRSADEPIRGEEGESRDTVLDRLKDVSTADDDPELSIDLQNMLEGIPDNLSEPLQYIIDFADRGNFNAVMKEVREKWDWTPTRLFNELIQYPEFVQFVESID